MSIAEIEIFEDVERPMIEMQPSQPERKKPSHSRTLLDQARSFAYITCHILPDNPWTRVEPITEMLNAVVDPPYHSTSVTSMLKRYCDAGICVKERRGDTVALYYALNPRAPFAEAKLRRCLGRALPYLEQLPDGTWTGPILATGTAPSPSPQAIELAAEDHQISDLGRVVRTPVEPFGAYASVARPPEGQPSLRDQLPDELFSATFTPDGVLISYGQFERVVALLKGVTNA